MHMADALLSPAVGGALWAAAAGGIALSSRRVAREPDDRRVPLMGVLGAFVFAVQMINFSLPGTGSSGHLGGGMLLAVLLGPAAALIVISSVLTVQALFFADGGLLALGCNIFNLGMIPCFLVYPLVFKGLARGNPAPPRLAAACILASVAALQLGAFAVVLETVLSGISALPLGSFALVMLPVHLLIGIVEGAVTAMIVNFLWRNRPEALGMAPAGGRGPVRGRFVSGFLLAALGVGVGLSWLASTQPDGLEWSIAKVAGEAAPVSPAGGVHAMLAGVQQSTAFLPDYGFRGDEQQEEVGEPEWPAGEAGSSVSALVGGAATLALVFAIGCFLRRSVARPSGPWKNAAVRSFGAGRDAGGEGEP